MQTSLSPDQVERDIEARSVRGWARGHAWGGGARGGAIGAGVGMAIIYGSGLENSPDQIRDLVDAAGSVTRRTAELENLMAGQPVLDPLALEQTTRAAVERLGQTGYIVPAAANFDTAIILSVSQPAAEWDDLNMLFPATIPKANPLGEPIYDVAERPTDIIINPPRPCPPPGISKGATALLMAGGVIFGWFVGRK